MRDEITGQRLLGIVPHGWQDPESLMSRTADQAIVPSATLVDTRFPDLSFWDTPTYNGACFADTGITRACIQYDSGFERAWQENEANDIRTEVLYVFPYFGRSTQPQQITTEAVQAAIDRSIPTVMFDAELDSSQLPPTGPEMRNAQTRACIDLIEQGQKRPRIYTAPWWWVPNHNNTPEFAERGVGHHLANYGRNDGTMQPLRENAPGYAWRYNEAHQYWSLANYCGRVERDMSYLWSDGLPEEEDKMTEDQVKEIVRSMISSAEADDVTINAFRQLMDLAINGGPDGFTDPQGNPLPPVRDKALVDTVNQISQASGLDPVLIQKLAAAAEQFAAALRAIGG